MGRAGVLEPFRGRNFSLYFAGQTLSLTGTWFQNLALSLVILEMTGSAQALSGVTAAQFLPMIALAVPAGRLADRFPPRTILMSTALVSAGVVTGLAILVAHNDPPLWLFYALVAVLGATQAIERAGAQAIIFELVGSGAFARAVALSTVAFGVSRSIGPGLAGLVFQTYGPVVGMAVNAASYLVVFVSLAMLDSRRLYSRAAHVGEPPTPTVRLLANRQIVTLLITNAIVALFTLSFMVTITTTVAVDFSADATAVGAAHALNAVGGIIGGVAAAGFRDVTVRALPLVLTAFGITVLLNAAAPSLAVFLVLAPLLGVGLGLYNGVLHTAAQLAVPPHQVGRMMALVNLGSYGLIPFGALFIGAVVDLTSGRVALAVGGAAALAAALSVLLRTWRGTGDLRDGENARG